MQTTRFQKIDATGQITESPDYVAILETRFNPFTGEPVKLIWNRNLIKVRNWKHAEKVCAQLDLCGRSDWRWPTSLERELINDKTRHGPALDPIFNSPEYGFEWTSTPFADDSDGSPSVYAWFVYCFSGNSLCGSQDGYGFVRAVCVSQ